jgi:hypothetical protein
MANDNEKDRGPEGSGRGGNPGQAGGSNEGDDHGGGHDKPVSIFVNEKPVALEDKRQTGLSIKQAAIAQKVPIELDFVLSIERGGGKTELIGDDQKITVHEGDRFLAIPNDDNS